MSERASAPVRRGFVSVEEGQVHYREAGWERSGTPLVMLHPSPGSALMIQPLIAVLGTSRRVIGTDTLGNGDSAPPSGSDLPISYFAEAHVRALDGLGIEKFDLYGSHTGANIACEIAIEHPERVNSLILDGLSLYTPEQREEMLERYAPRLTIDLNGSQLQWVWHFVRDVYLFWPWYRRDAAHRRPLGLPAADELHDKVVEVLKAARTYHIPYRAAIGYDKAPRLPLVRSRTLLACAQTDMFMEFFERVRALLPAARPVVTRGSSSPEALQETAAIFRVFLDESP